MIEKCFLDFKKMEGLGNDFIFVTEDELARVLATLSESDAGGEIAGEAALWQSGHSFLSWLSRKLCDRNFGIGADGLIIMGREPVDIGCDASWRYFNADGSVSRMCGNGLRCAALFVQEQGWSTASTFRIEIESGAVAVQIHDDGTCTADLGRPFLDADLIPVNLQAGKLEIDRHSFPLRIPFGAGSFQFEIIAVGMGNPHAVIFDPPFDQSRYLEIAGQIQQSEWFPEGVNVEFVRMVKTNLAQVWVMERGCGPTLACASGAAAVAVAAALTGRCPSGQMILELPGGPLNLVYDNLSGQVSVRGAARTVFKGSINLAELICRVADGQAHANIKDSPLNEVNS